MQAPTLMPTTRPCPRCAMDNSYPDGDMIVCADCDHEVDCKLDAGRFMLKACYLRKV